MVTRAELSSLETALRELAERIAAGADGLMGTPNEDVASDLYDAERSLRTARRRLMRASDGLRG